MATTQAVASTGPAATAYWRVAGMTYMSYANACATHLRKCLKEPFRTQTAAREQVHYKITKWVDGVPQKSEYRGTGGGE